MRCARCQHENPPRAKFCEECAAPLARTCGNCGTQLSPTAKFCPECAHPVAKPTAAEPRSAAPEVYTPKHLAEKILTSKSALEGERKQVTVLFCDVVESTRLAERIDPEVMHELMDQVLRLMAEAVHRYEGTVNQFLGDGLMALFGAPVALEDHALRAVQTALAIQETIHGYNEHLRRERSVEIRLRIGLNTGLVVVGKIGDDLRMDYTAVGGTTNLAARMQALAEPGTILATAATYRLVEGYVRSQSLGSVEVKGLSAPVLVYRILARQRRTRFEAQTERGLSQFVGRERELGVLHDRLARVREGRGQVIGVVAEPGVGKSRLLYEFRKAAERERITWLAGHCAASGQTTPYLPILELLRTRFHIDEGDNPHQIDEKLRQGVRQLDVGLEPGLSFLRELFLLPADDSVKRLDPKNKRQKTFEAIRALIVADAQRAPLVVVLEDLHWIDQTSEDYTAFLIESVAGLPLLLLTTYRPGYSVRWTGKTYYTQIALDFLSQTETETLMRGLLLVRETPQDLVRRVHEKAEGNPLFAEEITRSLVERGVLVKHNGDVRWAGNAAIEFPDTVQDIIRARIDRLAEPVKRTAQTAAVIGREFGLRLLTQVAETASLIHELLDTLKHAELIHEKRFLPELEYIFKHAVIQDVAYQSILVRRRKELHRAIGRAVEELYVDRLAEKYEVLAHHFSKGEDWNKALYYLRQAGAKAASRSANREAIAHLEQALVALGHLPESPDTLAQAIDLRFDLRNSLHPLGEFERVFGYLQEAERLARKLDDRRRLGWVSMYMSHYFWMVGDSTEVRTFAETALAIAEPLQDFQLQVAANFYLGGACLTTGDHRRAEDLFGKVVQSLEGDLSRERFGLAGFPAVLSRCMLAWSLAERGEFEEGIAHGQEGIRIAEALDHPYSLILACWGLGSLYGVKGELSQASRLLERGLALSRDWNVTLVSPRVMWPLGSVYARSGRVAEGVSLLEEALRAVESIGLRSYRSLVVVHLGEACLLADRLVDALALARRALALTRERGERGYEAWALHLLGGIASHPEPPDAATGETHYRGAMALASDVGMRPLVAHCHLGLGKLYRRTGKREQAHEHLATATNMYREMDMRFWVEKVEGELAELG